MAPRTLEFGRKEGCAGKWDELISEKTWYSPPKDEYAESMQAPSSTLTSLHPVEPVSPTFAYKPCPTLAAKLITVLATSSTIGPKCHP
jgi:hypothetical protein